MVDRYDQDRIKEFLQGFKDERHAAFVRNAKTDAGIVLALAGWHAYKQVQIQRRGK